MQREDRRQKAVNPEYSWGSGFQKFRGLFHGVAGLWPTHRCEGAFKEAGIVEQALYTLPFHVSAFLSLSGMNEESREKDEGM